MGPATTASAGLPPAYVPICGLAPLPGAVAWSFGPLVLAALALGLGLAWRCATGPGRRVAALAGWAVLAAALVSPLCNLAVALFSARILQHAAILFVAAPLLAWATLRERRGADGGEGADDRRAMGGAAVASTAFAVVLWLWHMPGPYDATLAGDVAWWAMHLSLLGGAVWMWRALLLAAAGPSPHTAVLAGAATGAQMALLGGAITMVPRPLYAAHASTTWAWGLSPLEDQQLGGLLMWVPGGLLFLGVLALALMAAMRRGAPAAEAKSGTREPAAPHAG